MTGSRRKSGRTSPKGSRDERLWDRVADTVKPLPPQAKNIARDEVLKGAAAAPTEKPSPTKKPAIKVMPANNTKSSEATANRPAKQAPAVGDIPRPEHKRLASGGRSIDFRLDLHGLTRDAALERLQHMLEDAVARGLRRGLVITGKGRNAENGGPPGDAGGRGVLAREVPQWLRTGPLSRYVSEVSMAARQHGGEGALYVVLKKSR